MARNAAAQNYPSTKALCFWVLLICLWSMIAAGDTHSLTCDIIVKDPATPLDSWCEGQCSVDGEPFLQYDNDKATRLGDLGKATDATEVWMDMIQRLGYLGKDLRMMLANTKQEMTMTSGQPTLQATMLSRYEHGQIIAASWTFNIGGNNSFLLDTVNMNWIPFDDEVSGIMNKWKDKEQFIKDLKIISTADCSDWLKELFKHQKEKPRPTSSATGFTQLPYTINTTQIPSSKQFSNKEIYPIIAVVSTIIISFVIVGIYKYVKRKISSPRRHKS